MSLRISMDTFDDDPFFVKPPAFFFLECCDCGLRHIVVVEYYRDGIRIGFGREDNEEERKI